MRPACILQHCLYNIRRLHRSLLQSFAWQVQQKAAQQHQQQLEAAQQRHLQLEVVIACMQCRRWESPLCVIHVRPGGFNLLHVTENKKGRIGGCALHAFSNIACTT